MIVRTLDCGAEQPKSYFFLRPNKYWLFWQRGVARCSVLLWSTQPLYIIPNSLVCNPTLS